MIPEFTPLTIAQAMKRTGRSRRTIDRWIKDGHLRTVDIGGEEGRVLIEKDVVGHEKQMRDNQKASRAVSASAEEQQLDADLRLAQNS